MRVAQQVYIQDLGRDAGKPLTQLGEVEFNGVVLGAGMGLGSQSLMHELGQDAPVHVLTDSSATIGICV